jgi:signal transduction histidine kinase
MPTARDAIVVIDASNRIRSLSAAVETLLGHSPCALMGKPLDCLVPGALRAFQTPRRPSSAGVNLIAQRADGSAVLVKVWITPVKVREQAEMLNRMVVMRPADDRILFTCVSKPPKRPLCETSHASRLEVIGRLACGMAHDVNNLLGVVRGSADLLLSGAMSNRDRREMLADVGRAADRGVTLTERVLAFGRPPVRPTRSIDLNDVLDESRNSFVRVLGHSIELMMNTGHGVGRVRCGRSELESILMNLLANARDAMTGASGGHLLLATRPLATTDIVDDSFPVSIRPGTYVRLTVQDNGCGMDGDTLRRAFIPFFTTKHRIGTGLGLAMAASVVHDHAGYLWIDSCPGVGTVVSVLLPTDRARSRVKPPRRRARTGPVRLESAGRASERST